MASEAVAKAIGIMAQLFGREISEEAILMLAYDLAEYPEDKVLTALGKCRKELRFFPTVADIVERINPSSNPESEAIEIASRMVRALHGYGADAVGMARAKELIGPIGWSVVTDNGGWANIVAGTYTKDLTFLKAQWRDLARVKIERGVAAPQLEDKSEVSKDIRKMISLKVFPK